MTESPETPGNAAARGMGFGAGMGCGCLLLIVGVLVVLAFIGGWGSARGEPVAGAASVIDGDTLSFADGKVRLAGMDAPERKQTCRRYGAAYACGDEAIRALRRLIGPYRVRCNATKRDRYGRLVATCSAGVIADLGARMVSDGWAVNAARYAPDYGAEEAAARAARRGLHAGTFVDPAAWRRGKR